MTSKSTFWNYYDHLHRNIEVLANNGKIGFSRFRSPDIQTKPNRFLEITKGYKNFHFSIDIPYASKVLNWEVIFDPEDFSELPDFDFKDGSFLPEPDINFIAENVPSWDNWDLTNSQSLLTILNEFLSLYKKSQVEKMYKPNKFSNLKTQYEDLLRALNLSEEQVEVLIEMKNEIGLTSDELIVAIFHIVLPIDFSSLPEYYQTDCDELFNPGEDFAYLNVQMKKLDNSQNKVSLTLSPRAEMLLCTLKLPKFRKDATLAEYAQAVQTTIEGQIRLICDQYHARNMFVSAIVDAFSSGIVEYDATRFYDVNFLYEDFEDYVCLVTVQLTDKFPHAGGLKIQVHSLYCQVGRSCNSTVAVQYDLQASYEDNVKVLRDTLHQEVKHFQNHKH